MINNSIKCFYVIHEIISKRCYSVKAEILKENVVYFEFYKIYFEKIKDEFHAVVTIECGSRVTSKNFIRFMS